MELQRDGKKVAHMGLIGKNNPVPKVKKQVLTFSKF